VSDIKFLSFFTLLVIMKFKAELNKNKKFTDFKPFRGGKGTEHVSEQVDKIFYE